MASKEPFYTRNQEAEPLSSDHMDDLPETRFHALGVAEAFIQANITNPVVASDIAAAAGLNVRALQRLFRKTYAATPTQVLLNARIAVAREMILRGEALSVRQVAAQLQFSNPSRFTKLYRKVHAHIPSQEIRQRQIANIDPTKIDQ